MQEQVEPQSEEGKQSIGAGEIPQRREPEATEAGESLRLEGNPLHAHDFSVEHSGGRVLKNPSGQGVYPGFGI